MSASPWCSPHVIARADGEMWSPPAKKMNKLKDKKRYLLSAHTRRGDHFLLFSCVVALGPTYRELPRVMIKAQQGIFELGLGPQMMTLTNRERECESIIIIYIRNI